jgi:hypothetical protein
LPSKFFGLFPAMGPGALAKELAVERSPYPLGAATTAPCLVTDVFTVWMVADIDGKHERPDFSEILLESPNWGKLWNATVQSGPNFPVLISKSMILSHLELVEAAGVELAIGTENTQVTDTRNA